MYVLDNKAVLAFYSQIPPEDDQSKTDFVSKDKRIESEVIEGVDGIKALVKSLKN